MGVSVVVLQKSKNWKGTLLPDGPFSPPLIDVHWSGWAPPQVFRVFGHSDNIQALNAPECSGVKAKMKAEIPTLMEFTSQWGKGDWNNKGDDFRGQCNKENRTYCYRVTPEPGNCPLSRAREQIFLALWAVVPLSQLLSSPVAGCKQSWTIYEEIRNATLFWETGGRPGTIFYPPLL